MYLHSLDLGRLKLKNNILLAPMAGITDLPFRRIVEKFEPGLVTTEMVSSKAILHNDEKTKKLMNMDGEKRPIAIQVFGSDVEAMSYASKYLSEFADVVDINMGCPAPKVVKNGDGSSLLKNLKLAEEIIKTVVENSSKPVTVKIRTGWDRENIVACEIAKIAEKAGVSAITVHGRTRTDYYSGKVDLEIIKAVKEAVSIPVIGNGDIVDEKSAKEMFERTGVDGIMIGRGSLGNPWIFEKIKYYLQTGGKLEDRPLNEKLDLIKEHFDLLLEEKGEYTAVREFRKHIAYYTKSMPNSSAFRSKINTLETKEEVINSLNDFFSVGDGSF